jgi:hypothetical protein
MLIRFIDVRWPGKTHDSRGAIHQCLRIILYLDSLRDYKPAKNIFLNLRIHF